MATSNLPAWPGADVCYSRAYRLLTIWSREMRVSYSFYRGGNYCTPTPQMVDLIDALNAGNEEAIKATISSNLELLV